VTRVDLNAAYGFRMDWIVSFVAVARYGGFSAAGKAVYRGQSRISEHVAELERALGVQLFDRTHPTSLTPEGRALLPRAEEILRNLQSLNGRGLALPPRRTPSAGQHPAPARRGTKHRPRECTAPRRHRSRDPAGAPVGHR
jgi:DNA-binding transcriptional LysR family regulator